MGREGERKGEKHQLPPAHTLCGTEPTTQARALTGNQTGVTFRFAGQWPTN